MLPTLNIRKGRGACGSSGMGLKGVTSYSLTRTCIKPINKLVNSLSGTPLVLKQTTGNSRLTRLTTARIQGKPPPSPIQYTLCLSAAPASKWLFVPRLPRSPKTIPVWTLGTLRDQNSLFRPLIRMKSQENLQLFSRAFQQCVALHLHAPGLGRFPTFSGWESNCQFDS